LDQIEGAAPFPPQYRNVAQSKVRPVLQAEFPDPTVPTEGHMIVRTGHSPTERAWTWLPARGSVFPGTCRGWRGNLAVNESAPYALLTAGNWKVDWKVLSCRCGGGPVSVDAMKGGAMYLRVELLRTVDGRLEGVVTTESGRQQRFSGTLDLLRILEELEPPVDRSLGQGPPR
jgi:hypothetical protein